MDSIWAENAARILAAVLGAAVGLLLKKWFLRDQTRGKIKYLTWTVRYTHPMASRIPDLKMTFNGEECEGLSETRFAIWNESSKMVDAKDIAPASPIVWRPKNDHKVLSARVIQQTHAGVNAAVHWDSVTKSVPVIFDYIEPTDGFVVSVLHSGPPSYFRHDAQDIEGSIKGFGKLSRKLGDPSRMGSYFRDIYAITPGWSRRFWLVFLGISPVSLAYMDIDLVLNQPPEFFEPQVIIALFTVFVFIAFTLSAVITMWRAKPPDDLNAFLETWDFVEVPKTTENANQPLNSDVQQAGSARPPRAG